MDYLPSQLHPYHFPVYTRSPLEEKPPAERKIMMATKPDPAGPIYRCEIILGKL